MLFIEFLHSYNVQTFQIVRINLEVLLPKQKEPKLRDDFNEYEV